MYAFVGASAAALSPVRAAPATCVSSFAGARLVAAPRVRPARMSMALGEDGLAEDLSAAKGCIEEGCEINAVQVRCCMGAWGGGVRGGGVGGGGKDSDGPSRVCVCGLIGMGGISSSCRRASAWTRRGRRTYRWLCMHCTLVVARSPRAVAAPRMSPVWAKPLTDAECIIAVELAGLYRYSFVPSLCLNVAIITGHPLPVGPAQDDSDARGD